MPRLADEWEEAEADRLHDQAACEHRARAEAVDERSREDAGGELRRGRRRDDEPRHAESETTDVVQVDDEERQHDAVAERVHDTAELEQPHVARQLRVE